MKQLGLSEQRTVFTDQIMAGKYHIGGRLSIPGVSVQVSAAKAGRLGANQIAAILGFADGLIRAGGVDDYRCAGNGVGG